MNILKVQLKSNQLEPRDEHVFYWNVSNDFYSILIYPDTDKDFERRR